MIFLPGISGHFLMHLPLLIYYTEMGRLGNFYDNYGYGYMFVLFLQVVAKFNIAPENLAIILLACTYGDTVPYHQIYKPANTV